MPIDEEELDRIDMSHAKYFMLLKKRLFLAPITTQPQKILDLGTGTGKVPARIDRASLTLHTRNLGH